MVNVPSRPINGLNQQTYQRLNVSLHLNLRRQIFIAVCDDLILRDRLAIQLQTELNPSSSPLSAPHASLPDYPRLVSLQLSLEDPNPLLQIAQWLTQSPPPIVEGQQVAIPAFQILGIEHLTRQSSAIQRLFFTHLQTIEQNLPLLDFSILLWMTQPWFHALPDSAPEFWHCRTGVFEFSGDPTPLTITSPERFGLQSSQQSIASTLPPAYLDSTVSSIGSVWTEAPQDDDHGCQIEETEFPPVAETEEPTHLSLPDPDSSPKSSERTFPESVWLPLIADDLQDENAPEELTQAEISVLLGDVIPAKAESSVDTADVPVEATDIPVETANITTDAPVLPLAEPDEAEEVLQNPWLALGEALLQPFEPSPVIDINQDATQEINQALEQPEPNEPEPVALAPDRPPPAVEETVEPSIAYTPIQLPEGLPQREQIQSVLQKIEQLHQQQAPVSMIVDAYRSLGNLFRDRIERGEVTPQNLIVAIQAYEQVLLRLSDASPLWVDILNDLGNLYWMASRTTPNHEEAVACLNQAIQVYQFALTKIDPQTQSQTYPMVQNNLGAAYADLARHDNPTENLQLSVEAYCQALRWRQPETDPLRYASTQNNLGTTYWNLAQYQDSAKNLKLSIAAYNDALQYYNPAEEPLNYAMIQNNLGTAYWNLSQHDRSQEWLMAAVSAYRMALKYRTLEVNPVAHAATQNNLGTAYWHIANETDSAEARVDFLQQAIEAYEGALQAVEQLQAHQPSALSLLNFDILATHNNLGLASYQIATDALVSLDTTKQTHYLQSALDHHVIAWQGWESKANLRQTAFNCIVQTMQAFYNQLGLPGQSLALSRVPGELLPEILPKL